MSRPWFALGALLAAASVGAGAFGAHGLRLRLDASSLALWETAARYLMYAALGLLAVGLASELKPRRTWDLAGAALALGGVIFAGTVGVLALGGPRWLGAITPVGGALLIVGFVAAALAAALRKGGSS